ncbi:MULTISPECIES: diguanylate cyclase [unclassified Methylophilus]|uniref:GGDEF domain-containing protein n=1 Tax=unclassified Methylophilus TaxID=2630143 RepID=UPI00037E65EC|nr:MULTISPECIES: diguanylate cyclase [unclassified Methylophilus]
MNRQRKNAVLYILVAGFLIAFVGVLLFVWIYFSSMREMHQTTRKLYEQPFAVANAALALEADLYQIRSSLLYATLIEADRKQLATTVDFIAAREQLAQQKIAIIARSYSGDQQQVTQLKQKLALLNQVRDQILHALEATRYADANRLIETQWTERFNEVASLNEAVLKNANQRATQYVNESQQRLEKHTTHGLTYAALLLSLFLVVGVFVAWRIYQLHIEADKFAFTDFLTGIANRRHFIHELESEVRRSQRYGSAFAFAMVDIDHFKKINDQYGHHAGDLILQNFCLRCVSALRTSDMVGRLGGEEFGILMPMTDLHEAARVIERLRSEIDHSVMSDHGEQIHYTASFGLVSTSQLSEQQGLAHLMKMADAALYAAKQQGRNRVFIANH